jgi:hypothetical protein
MNTPDIDILESHIVWRLCCRCRVCGGFTYQREAPLPMCKCHGKDDLATYVPVGAVFVFQERMEKT